MRSGTRDKKTHRRLKDMLWRLADRGRHDLIRAVRDGQVELMELYERYQLGDLDRLPTAEMVKPLVARWRDWMDGKEIAASTRKDYDNALERLLAIGSRESRLSDLPGILAKHRKASLRSHPRTFNKDRAAVLSFLANLFGEHHWLYGDCARHEVLNVVPMPINPQTPEQVRALADALAPQHARQLWSLCLTGMRPSEFFEEQGAWWRQHEDRIHIAGTKTKASVRDLPRVGMIGRPDTGRLAFYRALRVASGKTVTPYDLRRSYANWMLYAGIPQNRRDAYRAHSWRNMRELYERPGDLTRFLAEDAAALERYLGVAR